VANLGDCSLLIIRRGEVVFRTSEMQHAFNFPLQLGTHSRDEPMKDAKRYDIGVEKEDVVIVGSDGLMDNLVSVGCPTTVELTTVRRGHSGDALRVCAPQPARFITTLLAPACF
jgi:serine/threonine protein phosphatase PrpC